MDIKVGTHMYIYICIKMNGICGLLCNIICVYHHKMIKSHHGHPQTTKPGWQNHNYPLKTEQNIGPEKETYNRNLIAG